MAVAPGTGPIFPAATSYTPAVTVGVTVVDATIFLARRGAVASHLEPVDANPNLVRMSVSQGGHHLVELVAQFATQRIAAKAAVLPSPRAVGADPLPQPGRSAGTAQTAPKRAVRTTVPKRAVRTATPELVNSDKQVFV